MYLSSQGLIDLADSGKHFKPEFAGIVMEHQLRAYLGQKGEFDASEHLVKGIRWLARADKASGDKGLLTALAHFFIATLCSEGPPAPVHRRRYDIGRWDYLLDRHEATGDDIGLLADVLDLLHDGLSFEAHLARAAEFLREAGQEERLSLRTELAEEALAHVVVANALYEDASA